MAEDKVRASSSSSSLFTLNLPNGLGKPGQTVKMIRKRIGKEPIYVVFKQISAPVSQVT